MNTKSAAPAQAQAQDVVLPCPFCGGEPKHSDFIGNGFTLARVRYTEVSCLKCRITTGPVQPFSDNRAIDRWNRRAYSAEAVGWQKINTAPVGDASACIDIWCGQNDCRYVDCYWDRPKSPSGKPAAEPCWVREVYETGYGFYAVAIANPIAWMPSPTKPEGV